MAGGWDDRERPIGTALGRWIQGRRPFNAETQRRRDKRREKQKQARRGEQDSPLLQVARGGSAERGERIRACWARTHQAEPDVTGCYAGGNHEEICRSGGGGHRII